MKSSILLVVLVAVVVVAVVGGGSYYYYSRPVSSAANHSAQCGDPDSILSHVYNPDRLEVINPCIVATGIVDNVIEEADGDYHVRLALDAKYGNLTNSANDQYQYGDLVVEIICAHSISQQDAVSACQGYTNNITIPNIDDHITVTGPYVLDTDHYGWAEIHPAYTLTVD